MGKVVEQPELHCLHLAIMREPWGREEGTMGESCSHLTSQPARQACSASSGRGVSIDFPIASGPRAANPGPSC